LLAVRFVLLLQHRCYAKNINMRNIISHQGPSKVSPSCPQHSCSSAACHVPRELAQIPTFVSVSFSANQFISILLNNIKFCLASFVNLSLYYSKTWPIFTTPSSMLSRGSFFFKVLLKSNNLSTFS
jgi:hypothetical protein